MISISTYKKINEITLLPGDKVLLERGSIFQNGYLHVKGSGNKEAPIIIDCYGDKNEPKPLIATNGAGVWYQDYNLSSLDSSTHVLKGDVSSCILLYDVEYIEISNIAMTNAGNFASGETYSSADRMDRTGVAAVAQNIGTVDHIVLRDLDISNVQGNVYNKHMCNGGIYFVCAQPKDTTTGIAKYDDVLIEGCTLNNVNRWGIAVGYTCYWDKFKTAELSDDNVRTYGSTNVVVRDNYINDIGGDAITMMYCYQPMVERNVAVGFARDMNSTIYTTPVSQKNGGKNRGGMLAAGIWPWKCKTPVFQYNECYDAHSSQDSQAWDADSGDGCIYQYNYSSNNAGGAVMFCLQEAVNTVFRYNISQNDLGGILNLSSNPNGEIYNNVFYIKEGVPVNRMSSGKANIYNNIFYYAGSTAASATVANWSKISATWSNNIYYNFSTTPTDANKITADSLFVNGGSAPNSANSTGKVYDRSVFNGYKLQENSPAIDAGKPVTGAGGQDFFGNKLDMMPDIGAYETGLYVADSNAEIISTPYMIIGSSSKKILNVPSLEKNPTTTEDVLNNIKIAAKSSSTIFKGTAEVSRMLVEDGMVLRIYAESGVYRDYTIKIKNTYAYADDYALEQGNVWFYQFREQNGTYSNMAAQDEWGGWMESYNNGMSNTWATVSRENSGDGILCDSLFKATQGSGTAMAWRAPKSGNINLGFDGTNAPGGAKLRGTSTGGTVYLKLTKNGENLIAPIVLPSNGTAVTLDPQTVTVEQGDYIRIEAYNDITGSEITAPSLYVTPIIAYNNRGDSEAPSVPGNVTAAIVQAKKAVISWTASTDNVGVEGYNVYLNGSLYTTTTSTGISLTGLTKGQEYTVAVEAFDLANNVSSRGSATFVTADNNVIYSLEEPVTLDGSESGISLGTQVLNDSKSLNQITITAQFVAPTSIGSIISFAESTTAGNHFHLYANGVTLGYELRGTWGTYSGKFNCLDVGAGNAVALVADPSAYTIKLFANGKLVYTQQLTASTWKMLKDYTALDAVTVGWTPRNSVNSKYPFVGDILDLNVYSVAMSDQAMIGYTSAKVSAPEKEPHLFSATGSLFYRIPALLTLSDGSLMAAVDARFGSAGDSPNNLDTAVVFRRAGETEWEKATLPFHFMDISDKAGAVANNSASFIDPAIVQADDGTIYLMADAFPYGTGSGQSKAGSGMITVGDKKYLALTEKGKAVTSMANFTLYIKDDGTVWDSSTNSKTAYSVDENYNLYKDGNALTVQQRDPNLQYNGTRVPMNIFYEESELQVYRTSYLWMASSKNGGRTWSAPRILNDLKLESEPFLGFGPGRGYVISQGQYEGRILMPVYSTEGSRGERSSVIYSDDKGKTWKRGPATTLTTDTALNPGKTSEAQFVELPDGTIRMYSRGTTAYLGYADSADGVNYGTFKEDSQLAYCGNSMVSVINYSTEIDGKPALILSSPEHRENRGDGIIRIGLITENTDPSAKEKYNVDWKYRYEVNRDEFIYSCLTELPNGDIGMLYETHVDAGAPMNYVEYKLADLLVEENSVIQSITLLPENPQPGDKITVTVTLKKPATNPTGLSAATLEILYPESGLGKGALAFSGISGDNLVLTYTGTLPTSSSTYDYIIRMPEWCSHPTVGIKSPVVTTADGLVNPANKDTLYGIVGTGSVSTPVVTGFTASVSKLPAEGGKVTFTITGTNLANGITVKVGSLTMVTTGTASKQTAMITFPANASTEPVVYTAQYSLGGTNFDGNLSVTIAAAPVVVPTKPVVTAFTAGTSALTSAGGSVTFTITGTDLPSGITVKAGSLTTVTTTGTATEQTAVITFPSNASKEAEVIYPVQYSLDGTDFEGDLSITVAAAPIVEPAEPVVTAFTASASALTSAGGNVTFTITGTDLFSGITVKAGGLTAGTTGTATEQTAVITFPANTSAEPAVYTAQYSLDGTVFTDGPSITVEAEAPVVIHVPVRISSNEGGSVTVADGTGSIANGSTVPAGTVLTITAAADSDHRLDSLTVNSGSIVSGRSYTVRSDDTEVVVTARFTAIDQTPTTGSGTSSNPTTITKTVKNPDGSTTQTKTNLITGTVTVTTTYADGSQTVVETQKDGTVTTTVTVPENTAPVTILIPTPAKPQPGEVAAIVHPDGTREVIKTSVATEAGMQVTLSQGGTLKIIDNSKSFSDVSASVWFADAVQFVASRELFQGSGGAFAPNGAMTRSMVWTVLARLDGQDTTGGDNWYAKARQWAIESGISDGTAPDGSITREQLVTILYRFAGSPSVSGSLSAFPDADKAGSYAVDALIWAVDQGLLSGKDDGTLDPTSRATRAEVAALLMRYCMGE